MLIWTARSEHDQDGLACLVLHSPEGEAWSVPASAEQLAAIVENPARAADWVRTAGSPAIVRRPAVHPLAALSGMSMASGFIRTHLAKIPDVDPQPPVHPGWFFKGLAGGLALDEGFLHVSKGAGALCEEAEVVLAYHVDAHGRPRYLGFTFGNDLTDLGSFRRDPSTLAYAKLCTGAVASSLFLGLPPAEITGRTVVTRAGDVAWSGSFRTGTAVNYYSVEALSAHLFSHPAIAVPGSTHYVFLGADKGSAHHGTALRPGNVVEIDFAAYGVRLRHSLRTWGF